MIKIKLFVVVLLLISPYAHAECRGEVVDIQKSVNEKAVMVISQYYVDGVAEAYDDKKTYTPKQFLGLTKSKVLKVIENDILVRCGEVTLREYLKNTTDAIVANEKKVTTQLLKNLNKIKTDVLNISVTSTSLIFQVDTNNDGVNDETWTIETDGTKSVSNIAP